MFCVNCGKKESKNRVLVNNTCPECLKLQVQPNISALNIDDDSTLSTITFGTFKVWLQLFLQSAVQSSIQNNLTEITKEFSKTKSDLENTKKELTQQNKNSVT